MLATAVPGEGKCLAGKKGGERERSNDWFRDRIGSSYQGV